MEPTKKIQPKSNGLFVIGSLIVAVVLLNLLFLLFSSSQTSSITLLKKEASQLEEDRRIIEASSEISTRYEDEIDVISGVFPNEETILMFIQTVEGEIRKATETYSFKFNALTPLTDGDKMYLLFTITMNTDLPKLLVFLERMEKLPYMTQITGITTKTPGGFAFESEVTLGIKVYVQNPFSHTK